MLPCGLITFLADVLILPRNNTGGARREAAHDAADFIFVFRSWKIDEVFVGWCLRPPGHDILHAKKQAEAAAAKWSQTIRIGSPVIKFMANATTGVIERAQVRAEE